MICVDHYLAELIRGSELNFNCRNAVIRDTLSGNQIEFDTFLKGSLDSYDVLYATRYDRGIESLYYLRGEVRYLC